MSERDYLERTIAALRDALEEAADWLDADLAHAPNRETSMADRELVASWRRVLLDDNKIGGVEESNSPLDREVPVSRPDATEQTEAFDPCPPGICEANALALQRDDLGDRLRRIRAAADSDSDLARLPALRDFLLRETDAVSMPDFILGLIPTAGDEPDADSGEAGS